MGLISSFLSKLPFCSRNSRDRGLRVLILGLNAGVGKTTVLYRLKLGKSIDTMHTVGFNLETVETHNMKLDMWDIGGGDKITALWCQYFQGTKAVIFVIDSTDADRMDTAEFELTRLLNAEELENIPFLVLANKQDVESAMSLDKIRTGLKLDNWKHRKIHLQATIASQGVGLSEGMEWLCNEIANVAK